jgi:hypothetical protein
LKNAKLALFILTCMGNIAERKNSRFLAACFTSRDRSQLKRSTKTEDKNQAMEIAIEFERAERRAAQGALTTTQRKKVLNDVSEKVTGDALFLPTYGRRRRVTDLRRGF